MSAMFDFTLSQPVPASAPRLQGYDVIIVGGGPGGFTAGLYAARARLSALLIEKGVPGGQAAVTSHIENYPGFPEGMDGPELGQRMRDQAVSFGLEIVSADVTQVTLDGDLKLAHTDQGVFQAKALIVATGTQSTALGVPGEQELRGRGVSYCATCDGAFFRDQTVAVVGGGDSAIDETLFLTRFVKEAVVIHRRDALRATRILQDRAFANPKIRFMWDTVVDQVFGEQTVQGLVVRNVKTGVQTTLAVNGVFVYVGMNPNTALLGDVLKLDDRGYIVANEEMATSVPGIFAAGDVRVKSLRQVVTACADGAIAAVNADRYIQEQEQERQRSAATSRT